MGRIGSFPVAGETEMRDQMQLFKNLGGPVVLLFLCSCGGSETVPAGAGGAAPKPVVKYSRSGDAAVRKAVAEEALKQKSAGGAGAPAPSRKPPAAARENTVSQLPAKPGKEPQARPAPKPATRPASTEPRGASAAKPGARGRAPAEEVELLLRRLAGPAALARKAYVGLWGVGKEQIPGLIRQVNSKQLTRLIELDLLVLQKDFARYDEKEKRWYYWIKGMGNFEIDDIAMSKVSGRKGAVRVRMKKFGGFPLGVVIRAGLLNRFRSIRFPAVDDRKYLSRWWNLFYKQNASALK